MFLAHFGVANAFGSPPPDAATVAWAAQAIWLLVLWGYWVDGIASSGSGRRE